jgi:glycylpeptide N-tetradecanoyltransferase
MQVNKTIDDFIEVKLLCVHQQLRTKKLVPCLITELTRLFSVNNYSKGVFNANIYINKPLISSKYYLKPLNVDKLVDTGFLKLDLKNNKVTVDNIKKANEIITKNTPKNFVDMQPQHIEMSFNIFNKYMEKYNYHPIFTLDEFTHTFYNNEFVKSYVFEGSDDDGVYVNDFVSYYVTDIKVLKGEHKDTTIKKGTLFYYSSLNETSYSILKNILISANNNGIDVFCANGIMEHCDMLRELGFEEFGQELHYYLYNWKVRNMSNKQIGYIQI